MAGRIMLVERCRGYTVSLWRIAKSTLKNMGYNRCGHFKHDRAGRHGGHERVLALSKSLKTGAGLPEPRKNFQLQVLKL